MKIRTFTTHYRQWNKVKDSTSLAYSCNAYVLGGSTTPTKIEVNSMECFAMGRTHGKIDYYEVRVDRETAGELKGIENGRWLCMKWNRLCS
jgi:hypothetical protein